MLNKVTVILIGIVAGITFLNLGIGLLVVLLHRKRRRRLRTGLTERGLGSSATSSPAPKKEQLITYTPVHTHTPLSTPGPVPPSPTTKFMPKQPYEPPDYPIPNQSDYHARYFSADESSGGETAVTSRPLPSTIVGDQYSHRSGRSERSGRKKKHLPSLRRQLSVRSYDTESMYSTASAPAEMHEMLLTPKDRPLPPRLQAKKISAAAASIEKGSSGESTRSSVRQRNAAAAARLTMITEEMLAPEVWTGRSVQAHAARVVTNQRPLSGTSTELELELPAPILAIATSHADLTEEFLPTPDSMKFHPFAINFSPTSARNDLVPISVVVPGKTPAGDIRDSFLYPQTPVTSPATAHFPSQMSRDFINAEGKAAAAPS